MMTETDLAPAAPLARDEAVLKFLATRRSRSARTLAAPGPDRAALVELLRLAVRVPDHGKLEPWRFVVIGEAARPRVIEAARAAADAAGLDAAAAEKAASAFGHAPVIVAVVSRTEESRKIPRWEQEFSAAAVCLSLLNAALASGWGANWLTGPLARNSEFLKSAFGLSGSETVAGFVHIGTETVVPQERPRPDPETLTTWL